VIDNTLTDPVDIGLIQPHFTCPTTGEIIPTKSFADSTRAIGYRRNISILSYIEVPSVFIH
jgi:hypothetical protein